MAKQSGTYLIWLEQKTLQNNAVCRWGGVLVWDWCVARNKLYIPLWVHYHNKSAVVL